MTKQQPLFARPREPLMGVPAVSSVRQLGGAAAAGLPITIDSRLGGRKSDGAPSAALRHALRAIASEAGVGLRGVTLLRPLVAQAHETLGERLEAGGSVEDYLRGRTRLADSAVVGLLHVAAVSTGMLGYGKVAPIAAVAVGGYGRRELAPGSDLDLLFLLPESGQSRDVPVAAAACIKAVVAGLWDLGFVLDHAARSPQECIDLARREPTVVASLVDRRFLWGGFALFSVLDADLAGFFSGPLAASWRGAVNSALTTTPHGAWASVDEPDVKRGPGGLRDLRRALLADGLASGRPPARPEPTLIEAHRFLWLVRCHLHLLAGRAEDRLGSALQPGVARRLGFDEPREATAASRLMQLFHGHAHNVLQAAARATTSVPA